MSTNTTHFTACPIIRTEAIRAARWIDGPVPGSRILARFDLEVSWLIESETVPTEYLWDGEPLFESGGTYKDYYGFLTSTSENGQRAAQRLALTVADRLEVISVTTVTERPVHVVKREPGKRMEYEVFERILCDTEENYQRLEAYSWNAEHKEGDWHPGDMKLLEPKQLAKVVIYSSKRTDEENAAALQGLRDQFAAYLPQEAPNV
jgi:hypothetical protein